MFGGSVDGVILVIEQIRFRLTGRLWGRDLGLREPVCQSINLAVFGLRLTQVLV
ncbi:hypothetical protein PGT21_000649 [Puccinia graminis f. sp. tritici]|uniref:Uncharacterized protein n=1 Tax=Puccinia graminis f. sp. tritici TaxID=56615 RepID=A0A5B0N0M1_PUCGR|nr:hypothetical protein PGT21_000649 [Puccinia graminis f. sp. tritici]